VEVPWSWTRLDIVAGPLTIARWKFQASDLEHGVLEAGNSSDRPLRVSLVVTIPPGPPAEVRLRIGEIARRRVVRQARGLSIEGTIEGTE